MIRSILLILLFLPISSSSIEAQHPCLTLTKNGVEKIKSGINSAPLFSKELANTKKEIDQSILNGIDVPIPKDMAGGYTHEQHKRNYKLMHKAGNLYQFSGETKYAQFVKEMLFEYSNIYALLPLHPTKKSYATGKIFWQCLNDANWLVFTSQAYDCIYDFLSPKERTTLEKDLFIPFADFLSEENPRFFNRIHNHSTWANAAVGMIALVMKNDSLLNKALYGLKNDGIDPSEIDNDGGFIKKEGQKPTGFLAQLDYSFSPDGYFAEGPYYQRYAIFPFLVFSHALHNNRPDLKIFEYRNGILKKATNSLLQLTDPQGNFFAINDAQKGMSYKAYELVTAVNLMYFIDNNQKHLLDWAFVQEEVAFNEAGFLVAQMLAKEKPSKPAKSSLFYADGVDGKEGGVAALRLDETELLFKFSTQGMGHGHFDRLSYSMYNKAGEVLQDYGAVRWVNIDQKAGGRYLPENKTFGKQTIAHNTLVVDESSQFGASVKKAEAVNPKLNFVDFDNSDFKIISAQEDNAYENVAQQRTIMIYRDPTFDNPIILDLFVVQSESNHILDLPFWYEGHLMKSSFTAKKSLDALTPLGETNGYQHIWKESMATLEADNFKFNWFGNNHFYTLHGLAKEGDQVFLGRAGANDPNFNLRPDPVFICRKENAGKTIFFNIIESHGTYSTITEIPNKPFSEIVSLKVDDIEGQYMVCSFGTEDYDWNIFLATKNTSTETLHEISYNGVVQKWKGVHSIKKTKK